MNARPSTPGALNDDAILAAMTQALRAGNFCVAPPFALRSMPITDVTEPWEIFRGRLLEASQCLEERRFRFVGQIFLSAGSPATTDSTDSPTLAIHWDQKARTILVTRTILSYVWEGYDSGDNVILSRETARWVRELIGVIATDDFDSAIDLRDEIACQLFLAVVGTSRLPLTSTEAPLPAFTLGQLGYFPSATADDVPVSHPLELLNADLPRRELTRLLELVLRWETPTPERVQRFIARWLDIGREKTEIVELLRTVFNEASLSPWTAFTDHALVFVRELVRGEHITVAAQIDFLGFILRQLGRHLTAYDLITFHYRGANYPDALLLDAVLREYIGLIETHPELFATADKGPRLRRRALRQACLLRQYYVGHLVPDAPTSPGENARILPAPHQRVPEEQILQAARRKRQLYADVPLADILLPSSRTVLLQSAADLTLPSPPGGEGPGVRGLKTPGSSHPSPQPSPPRGEGDELQELGTAIFIDRPLGFAKLPGEPDQTPLLAHEAFGRSIAQRRLGELRKLLEEMSLDAGVIDWEAARATLDRPHPGPSVHETWCPDRPVVSLADAKRVADDFVLLRTVPSSVRQFASLFHIEFLEVGRHLIVLIRPGVLAIFDREYRKLAEVEIDVSKGYRSRAGVEWPAAGVRVQMIG